MSYLETNSIEWDRLIDESESLYQKLFPICRSFTGNGVKETLRIIQNIVDFKS